jgi:hypothetical protein
MALKLDPHHQLEIEAAMTIVCAGSVLGPQDGLLLVNEIKRLRRVKERAQSLAAIASQLAVFTSQNANLQSHNLADDE